MAAKPLPPVEIMRQLLRYEPDTGKLYWRERTPEMFRDGMRCRDAVCQGWNKRFAGNEAFPQLREDGYRYGRLADRKVMAHRVAWAIFHGKEPVGTVDHINGDRSDNRIGNLRDCPMSVNAKNLSLRKDNKYGVAGIRFRGCSRSTKQWLAVIKVDGRSIHLGSFESIGEAIRARRDAESRYGFHRMTGKQGRGYFRR